MRRSPPTSTTVISPPRPPTGCWQPRKALTRSSAPRPGPRRDFTGRPIPRMRIPRVTSRHQLLQVFLRVIPARRPPPPSRGPARRVRAAHRRSVACPGAGRRDRYRGRGAAAARGAGRARPGPGRRPPNQRRCRMSGCRAWRCTWSASMAFGPRLSMSGSSRSRPCCAPKGGPQPKPCTASWAPQTWPGGGPHLAWARPRRADGAGGRARGDGPARRTRPRAGPLRAGPAGWGAGRAAGPAGPGPAAGGRVGGQRRGDRRAARVDPPVARPATRPRVHRRPAASTSPAP